MSSIAVKNGCCPPISEWSSRRRPGRQAAIRSARRERHIPQARSDGRSAHVEGACLRDCVEARAPAAVMRPSRTTTRHPDGGLPVHRFKRALVKRRRVCHGGIDSAVAPIVHSVRDCGRLQRGQRIFKSSRTPSRQNMDPRNDRRKPAGAVDPYVSRPQIMPSTEKRRRVKSPRCWGQCRCRAVERTPRVGSPGITGTIAGLPCFSQ